MVRMYRLRVANPLRAGFVPVLLLALVLGLTGAAEAADHEVLLVGMSFQPSQLTIQKGDRVTWRNTGGLHNVRARDGSFTSGQPSTALFTFSHTFDEAGAFEYFCQVHDLMGMNGRINVQPGTTADPGTLRFGSASTSVNEGAGQASIGVVRAGGDDGMVSVEFATANGSATAGADYTPRSGTLTFADNEDGTKTFTVPILNDAVDESNETVNLSLSNPGGGATLGSPSSATLTIIDNDDGGSAGTLAFAVAELAAGESSGTATAIVRRTGGAVGAVSAQVTTSNGSAIAGDDYGPVSQTVSWAAADVADKTVSVPIFSDSEFESNETVNLALSNATGGAALGTPGNLTLTILDDDFPTGPCQDDADTLCLHDGRFAVEVDFRPPGGALQHATVIPLSERAGLFWFFNEANVEMLVKVQNACVQPFNRWWVFYAATTNVEFVLRVIDTQADQVRFYSNPQGTAAAPVQDTQAFATCP